jgi:hypothetical protein
MASPKGLLAALRRRSILNLGCAAGILANVRYIDGNHTL